MGIQDRDYYREWWQKKVGYIEKARFRLPASQDGRGTDDDAAAGAEYLPPPPDPPGADWHWTLKLIFLLLAAVVILVFRKLLK